MGILEDIAKGAQTVYNNAQNDVGGAIIQGAQDVTGGVQGLAGDVGKFAGDFVQSQEKGAQDWVNRGQEVYRDINSGDAQRSFGEMAERSRDDFVSGAQGLAGDTGRYAQGFIEGQQRDAGAWINQGREALGGAGALGVAGLDRTAQELGRRSGEFVEGQRKGADDWLNAGRNAYDTIEPITRKVSSPLGVAALAAGGVAGLVGTAIDKANSAKNGIKSAVNPESGFKSEFDKGNDVPDKNYPVNEGEIEATYKETQVNRAGFKSANDLGFDRKTWALIAQGYTPLQAVTMRLEEKNTPAVRRELDWQQGQLLQNDIESSSAEHHGKANSTNPADWTPNTKENVGDMALTIKQGSRVNRKSQLSDANPAVSGVLADMPGGAGQEDYSWLNAMDSEQGFSKKAPSLLKAVNTLETARKNNDIGVYGGLTDKRDASPFLEEVTYNKKIGAATVNGSPNKDWDALATVMGIQAAPPQSASPKSYSVKNPDNRVGTASVSGSESPKTIYYYDQALMRGEPLSWEQARAMERENAANEAKRAKAMGGFGGKKKHVTARPKTRNAANRNSDKLIDEILYGKVKPITKKIKQFKSNGDALMNEILHGTKKPVSKKSNKPVSKKPVSKPTVQKRTTKRKGFDYSNTGI